MSQPRTGPLTRLSLPPVPIACCRHCSCPGSTLSARRPRGTCSQPPHPAQRCPVRAGGSGSAAGRCRGSMVTPSPNSPSADVPHAAGGQRGAATPSLCPSLSLCSPEGSRAARARRQRPAEPLASGCSTGLWVNAPGQGKAVGSSQPFTELLRPLQSLSPGRGELPAPGTASPGGWETCPAPKATPGSGHGVHHEKSQPPCRDEVSARRGWTRGTGASPGTA